MSDTNRSLFLQKKNFFECLWSHKPVFNEASNHQVCFLADDLVIISAPWDGQMSKVGDGLGVKHAFRKVKLSSLFSFNSKQETQRTIYTPLHHSDLRTKPENHAENVKYF